jgi:CheY-like chemotaxis protein
MANATVLVADNKKDYLDTLRENLESQGFDVVAAATLADAKRTLERGDVDLAVIDLRLINDADEKDVSGLDLAKQFGGQLPKIIMTSWPDTPNAARDSLRPQLSGLPPAVDFLDKGDGWQVLVTAINKALALSSRYRRVTGNLAATLLQDHDDARQQAKWKFVFGLIAASVGILIIFFGAYSALGEQLQHTIPRGLAGLISSAIALLFFKQSREANERMDGYHRELVQIRGLEILMSACDELPPERRQNSKERVIGAASQVWLAPAKPKRAGKVSREITPS